MGGVDQKFTLLAPKTQLLELGRRRLRPGPGTESQSLVGRLAVDLDPVESLEVDSALGPGADGADEGPLLGSRPGNQPTAVPLGGDFKALRRRGRVDRDGGRRQGGGTSDLPVTRQVGTSRTVHRGSRRRLVTSWR